MKLSYIFPGDRLRVLNLVYFNEILIDSGSGTTSKILHFSSLLKTRNNRSKRKPSHL